MFKPDENSYTIKIIDVDSANPYLNLEKISLHFENEANLYFPGETWTADVLSEKFANGHISFGGIYHAGLFGNDECTISGSGNIFCQDSIRIASTPIDFNISMYAQGDILLTCGSYPEIDLKGMFYSHLGGIRIGDNCSGDLCTSDLKINGSVISSGLNPSLRTFFESLDSGSLMHFHRFNEADLCLDAENITLNFDDKVYGRMCATDTINISFSIIGWYEF